MSPGSSVHRVAIACGGTGGHLFPGLAVAEELTSRGTEVTLFVSPKEVDQRALRSRPANIRVETIPAVGLSARRLPAYLRSVWLGYRHAHRFFRSWRPAAVLAMGGFTSVAPVLAGRRLGVPCYLHESNAVPGRANRWLSRWSDACFLGFSSAGSRLACRRTTVTGTPVRVEFRNRDAAAARTALGLDPSRPMLLVMGGSQGALGVNQLVVSAMPALAARHPELQFCHLTGSSDLESVRSAYGAAGVPAQIQPFSHRMDLMLAAATVAVSRSGASSLAELAAVRVPSVLIPFPQATDDHQRLNAAAFVGAGAARVLDQATASPDEMVSAVCGVLEDAAAREAMRSALVGLDAPSAAARIADALESRSIPDERRTGRCRHSAESGNPVRSSGGARTGFA